MVRRPTFRFEKCTFNINLGKFCHALLSKTARWRPGTTLVEIVKAVTEHIDNPDADYAVTLGKFLFLNISSGYFCFLLFIEIGKEYMENRMEFNRKALEMAKKYGLPRN